MITKFSVQLAYVQRYPAVIFFTSFHMLYFLQINLRKFCGLYIQFLLDTSALDTRGGTQHLAGDLQHIAYNFS